MMRDSYRSTVPDWRPISARTASSSRETPTVSSARPVSSRGIRSSRKIIGLRASVSTAIGPERGPARDFQYVAPSVFGMISEKTRMENVSTAEATPTHRPSVRPRRATMRAVSAPTPAAPNMLAMVLVVRIAMSG